MNLGAFRSAVNRRTGHFLTDDALTDIINEALRALSMEARWPWLDASSTLTWADGEVATTTMPWAWQVIRAVTVDGRQEYRPRSQRDVETFTDGQPGWTYGYAVHGRTITLAPAPRTGATVKILGTRHEDALVNAVDEPFLPDEDSDAVVQLACALAFDRHNDAARYARHQAAYEGWVRRLKRSVRDQAQGPRTPRVRPGSLI